MTAYLGRWGIVATCLATAIAATAPAAQPAAADNGAMAAQSATSPTAGGNVDEGDICSHAAVPTDNPSEQAAGQGDQHRRACPRGIRSCSAAQVGQPCDPNNLSIICSAQANGAYCCLAYAGGADASKTQPAEAEATAAAGGGGGPCCTHQDKTACDASCQGAGCSRSIAACINLRCSCRCSGCP